jgi:hypothetical protein
MSFRSLVPRSGAWTVSNSLTLQYDKVVFLLEPNAISSSIRQEVAGRARRRNGGSLCAAELRAGRGLPVRLVARGRVLSTTPPLRRDYGNRNRQICQTLGYPVGSWGLSQKIFQRNFDLHGQIKWINQQIVLNG